MSELLVCAVCGVEIRPISGVGGRLRWRHVWPDRHLPKDYRPHNPRPRTDFLST